MRVEVREYRSCEGGVLDWEHQSAGKFARMRGGTDRKAWGRSAQWELVRSASGAWYAEVCPVQKCKQAMSEGLVEGEGEGEGSQLC